MRIGVFASDAIMRDIVLYWREVAICSCGNISFALVLFYQAGDRVLVVRMEYCIYILYVSRSENAMLSPRLPDFLVGYLCQARLNLVILVYTPEKLAVRLSILMYCYQILRVRM